MGHMIDRKPEGHLILIPIWNTKVPKGFHSLLGSAETGILNQGSLKVYDGKVKNYKAWGLADIQVLRS